MLMIAQKHVFSSAPSSQVSTVITPQTNVWNNAHHTLMETTILAYAFKPVSLEFHLIISSNTRSQIIRRHFVSQFALPTVGLTILLTLVLLNAHRVLSLMTRLGNAWKCAQRILFLTPMHQPGNVSMPVQETTSPQRLAGSVDIRAAPLFLTSIIKTSSIISAF